MKSKKEKYLELINLKNEAASMLNSLKTEIDVLLRQIEELEDEALRLEILRDPRVEEKKAKIQELRAEVERLQEEKYLGQKKLKVIDDLIKEAKEQAYSELRNKFRKMFEKKAIAFVRKAKEALELELELENLRQEAIMEANTVGSTWVEIDPWEPVLMRERGSPAESRLEKFINRMRAQHLNLKSE